MDIMNDKLVGYSEFSHLCGVKDGKKWGDGILKIYGDGVYIDESELAELSDWLTPQERAHLTKHPTGNLTEPILKFPCSLSELRKSIKFHEIEDYIDPFGMAEWAVGKVQKTLPERPIAEMPKNLRPSGSHLLQTLSRAIDDFPKQYPRYSNHPPKLDDDIRLWLKETFKLPHQVAYVFGSIISEFFGLSVKKTKTSK